MFRLEATLPKNRYDAGTARLLAADGAVVMDGIPCRGKADNFKAMDANNPLRDPTRPWGDTPTGAYEPARVTRFDPPHRSFGRYAILLEGVSGQALEARANGRTDLAVHGGRGDARLVTTYGCLRMFDRDLAAIAAAAGDDLVAVEILEKES